MESRQNSLKYDRSSRINLLLVLLLLASSLATTIHRLTLPTDGWLSKEPDEANSIGYIYEENVIGAISELQPGDHLVAVEGASLNNASINGLWSLKPVWFAGNSVRYTIVRQGETLEISVPLVEWQLSSFLRSSLFSPVIMAGWLGILIFLAIGFLVFYKRPHNPAAQALLVLSAALAYISIGYDALPVTVTDFIDPISSLASNAIIFITFSILLPPAFIRFALVFPHPKPVIERYPKLALLPYAVGGLVSIAFLMQMWDIGWTWVPLSILIAIILLVHNAFTMRDSVSRAQLRWGLGGMIVGLGMILSTFVTEFSNISQAAADLFNALAQLGFVVIGITLAIAILRYRLYDIDLIIRKTLQYALLTGLLALVYFGSVVLLQSLFENLTGQESPIVIVISTLAIAALFNPLRRRVQNFIDRRFFRRKYNAELILANFSKLARDEVDMEKLTTALVTAVNETMQPDETSLWLKKINRSTIL